MHSSMGFLVEGKVVDVVSDLVLLLGGNVDGWLNGIVVRVRGRLQLCNGALEPNR